MKDRMLEETSQQKAEKAAEIADLFEAAMTNSWSATLPAALDLSSTQSGSG